MRIRPRLSAMFLVLPLLLSPARSAAQVADAAIRYTVSMPQPWTHYYEVRMQVDRVDASLMDFQMPSWTPGSYLMREFPQNVEAFSARSGDRPLEARKVDKNTWRVTAAGVSSVEASYRVYANDLSVRTSGLDETYGFIAPADVLMFVKGRMYEPHVVELEPYGTWRTYMPLPAVGDHAYLAPDYDWVVDSPISMGSLDILEFEAEGVPHRFVFNRLGGPVFYDLAEADQLIADTKAIIHQGALIFGGLPYPDYTFMVLVGGGGGGIEHLNGTSLGASRFLGANNDFRSFMGLIAHEWFHCWNVKRIHPEALGPFDYTRENYTTLLWQMEGVDSYYADLIRYRAGMTSRDGLLGSLANAIRSMAESPGAAVQSPAEASLDAWVKQYRSNENAGNRQFSYYTSGQVLGALLDLRIRGLTEGRRGLDDVQRLLWERYGSRGLKGTGYTEDGFKNAVEEVSGADFTAFFRDYVEGTVPIPWDDFLGEAGYRLQIDHQAVMGPNGPAADLGAGLGTAEGGYPTVRNVVRGSNAWDQGLQYGDVIVGADGLVTSGNVLAQLLGTKRPGETVDLLILRNGRTVEQTVTLGTQTRSIYRIVEAGELTPARRAVREAWLGR